jgi:hypothetical protein
MAEEEEWTPAKRQERIKEMEVLGLVETLIR